MTPKKVAANIINATIANHKHHCKKIVKVGGFCIFFQGVKRYVVKVTSIKNNKRFVKFIDKSIYYLKR